MKTVQKLLLGTALGLLLSASTLLADTMTPLEISEKAYSALDSRQSYTFEAVIVNYSDDGSNKHQVSVKVNRPNQVRIDVKGDIKNTSSYLNNGIFTIYDHDQNMYVHIETAKSIEKTLDILFERFDFKAPLAQLIYSNMENRLIFDKSKNFGIVDLAGEESHYIAFSDKKTEVHAWVKTGDEPLIKHYRIVDKTSKNNAYKSTTIHWEEASSIAASDFVFTAPKNAQEAFIK